MQNACKSGRDPLLGIVALGDPCSRLAIPMTSPHLYIICTSSEKYLFTSRRLQTALRRRLCVSWRYVLARLSAVRGQLARVCPACWNKTNCKVLECHLNTAAPERLFFRYCDDMGDYFNTLSVCYSPSLRCDNWAVVCRKRLPLRLSICECLCVFVRTKKIKI